MAEAKMATFATRPASEASRIPAGHNGGPPLDQERKPEWGEGGIGNYFYWKAAHRAAWHTASRDVVLFRMQRAERLGLTYEEYTLEILERGRHLQVEDVERIAQIKQARSAPRSNDCKMIDLNVGSEIPCHSPGVQPSCLKSK